MAELEDQVRIRTNPVRLYEALTRTADYQGWWAKKSTIADGAGGTCTLEIENKDSTTKMKFKIDVLERQRRVVWSCTAHDTPGWVGTTLQWSISPAGDHMILTLVHAGWKDKVPDAVKQGWQQLLASLKSYLETGKGQPQ